MTSHEERIAEALLSAAAEIGARWCERAPVAAAAVHGLAESYRSAADEVVPLVRGIAAVLGETPAATPALIRDAWRFGAGRFSAGAVLHQLICELQLLDAIVLHAAERASRSDPSASGEVSDGLALARVLQRATAMASLSATRGFTQAHLESERQRFRLLRHDLRSPLGTIRNAIALLRDETLPARLRDPERFRAIVDRNAAVADVLVSRELDDGAVLESTLARRELSLRDVAIAVRRLLRQEAALLRAEIVVADELPVIMGDAASMELVLLVATAGALEAMRPGDGGVRPILIELDAMRDRSVRLRISGEFDELADAPGIALAQEVARWAGGELSAARSVVVELPASAWHPSDDLAGARQGQHG